MIGALIIVFREVFEAGLIVGIMLAVTRGVTGGRKWIAGGVLAGLAGSILVALFTSSIAEAFNGYGQELFNAIILGIAVLMLGWHNIWMARHGRSLSDELRQAGREVTEGKRSVMALAIVVATAVLREGAEVVLFLYGVAVSDGGTAASFIAGGLAGLVLGAAVSALAYLGLVRIPARHVFAVTSWLITLMAAGMAAQSVSFLEAAGIVPVFGSAVWNSSGILPDGSILGRVLHTLVGYSDQPSILMLLAYVTTFLVIVFLTRNLSSGQKTRPAQQLQP